MPAENPHLALIPFLLLGVSLSRGQIPQIQELATPLLQHGVVVERVAKYSEAEKAGLAEGDIILRWSRGDARGEIRSPFALASIETEEAPRGVVALEGLRGTESRVWQLGPDNWSIQVRPNFPDPLLTVYREGQQLAAIGKLSEAEARWRAIAAQSKSSDPPWLRPWVFFRIAQLQGEARQWKESDQAYQESVRITPAEEQEIAAQLQRAWAGTFLQRSDWARANEHYRLAIASAQHAGNDFTRAMDMENLGNVAYKSRDLPNAAHYYQEALQIREKLAPGGLTFAASLNNLGNVAFESEDLTKAEQLYRQALEIRGRIAPGSLAVAKSLNNLGIVASTRGELAKAGMYHGRAYEILKQLAPGSLAVAASLNNQGNVAIKRGDVAKAEEYYRRALEIRQNLAPDSLDVAISLQGLAVVASARGDLTRAEEYYRRALLIQEKLAPNSSDVASSLISLGVVLTKSGDLTTAERLERQALGMTEKLSPGSLDAALTFNNLGWIAFRRGDLDNAEKYDIQALAIREKLAPTSPDLAWNLKCLGDVVRDRGQLERAEQYYSRALGLWDQLAPASTNKAESLAGLASIMRQRGQLDAAAQLFEQALTALEGQTAMLGGAEEIRAGFGAKYESYYQDYTALLILQGKTDLAFQVTERSRARTLLTMLASAHLDIHRGADPELLQKERSLREDITARSDRRIRLLGRKHLDEQIAEVDKEIADLRDQYQAVEARLRAASPGYAALTQPRPLTTDQVQRLLDVDTVLLEYSLGEKQSYVFAVTFDSVIVRELSNRAEIERVARGIYDSITARNRRIKNETISQRQARWSRADGDYLKLTGQLGQIILGPVAAEIRNKRLLIVSDGALQYIPFAALPAPETVSQTPVPLMVRHEVVNLPSASILALLRRQEMERKAPAKTVAVLADPVFTPRDPRITAVGSSQSPFGLGVAASYSSDDLLTRSVRDVGLELSRLPFTRREAEAIFSLAPPNQAMKVLDFNANREVAAGSELSQYRIVHFATHGLLDSRQPELSGLVLSLVEKDGKPQSGFLALEDIYNLNLPAELVVLSACETGLGKEIKGEGLIGLTRGFMYAGASRVMASLWSVNDAATAVLMGRFYQGVLRHQLTPAAALRNAQRDLWQHTRWKSPYYWAAFQLQGDWK